MKRIMVATDFSTRSDRALRRATLLARQHDAMLLLLHVVAADQPRKHVDDRCATAADWLADLAATLRQFDGIPCETLIEHGEPAAAIVSATARVGADLLVLGPHRRQGVRDVFSGTTAERSIRAAACPVLMASAPPLAPYRHALLTCDLSDSARHVARQFNALRPAGDMTPSILHVFDAMTLRMATASPLPPGERERLGAQARAAAATALATFVDTLDTSPMTQLLRYQDASVANVTLATAREIGADLLVVGTRGRSGLEKLVLGSVAEAVLRNADRDVLAIPPNRHD